MNELDQNQIMLLSDFDLKAAFRILLVGFLSGSAAFLFMPLIIVGVLKSFTASFLGVLITLPLIVYFLQMPREAFNFREYFKSRKMHGTIFDIIMMLLVSMAPGIIILYSLLGMGFMSPVPVAASAAVAVFTGYSAFLYRNRKFYRRDRVEIEL